MALLTRPVLGLWTSVVRVSYLFLLEGGSLLVLALLLVKRPAELLVVSFWGTLMRFGLASFLLTAFKGRLRSLMAFSRTLSSRSLTALTVFLAPSADTKLTERRSEVMKGVQRVVFMKLSIEANYPPFTCDNKYPPSSCKLPFLRNRLPIF